MLEIQVEELKTVWVAWTNEDRTEGRGFEVPLYVTESMETAQRLGKKGGVMGCDCKVSSSPAFKIGGMMFIPGKVIEESREDAAKRTEREAREAALDRARLAGLSEADISILAKR